MRRYYLALRAEEDGESPAFVRKLVDSVAKLGWKAQKR
jgi:hypothetical protein